jgi:hypothetical protein
VVLIIKEKEKMNKLPFVIPIGAENVKTVFLGQDIEIKPLISLPEQIDMIRDYVKNYFSDGDIFSARYNFFQADLLLKVDLIQAMTSIDVEKDFDIVVAEANGIMELIEENVGNYWEFQERLEETVSIIEEQKESEKTLGAVIDGFVEKISEFATKLSVEDIDKIKEGVSDILKQVDESSVSQYLKEAKVE